MIPILNFHSNAHPDRDHYEAPRALPSFGFTGSAFGSYHVPGNRRQAQIRSLCGFAGISPAVRVGQVWEPVPRELTA